MTPIKDRREHREQTTFWKGRKAARGFMTTSIFSRKVSG
jgi:hypothetical protein